MNADPRVPFGAPSASEALSSRGTRRASTQTTGNSTALSSATLPRERRSSLQMQAQQLHTADCLCTACHLKTFPRRQDGRIVLPAPWLMPFESAGEPRLTRQNPSSSGEMENHVPSVAEATSAEDSAPCRRIGESSTRDIPVERNTDRGEGSSRGVPRLSGPGVPPNQEFPYAPLNTAVAERRRSNADRPRSYRYPKPYSRPPERTPIPHAAGIERVASPPRPGIDPSAIYLHHPSSLGPTTQSPIDEMGSWRNPYGNLPAGPSESVGPRAQLGNPASNRSTSLTMHPRVPSQGVPISTVPTSTRGSPNILTPMDRRQDQYASWQPPQNESQATPQKITLSHPYPSTSRSRVPPRNTPLNTHLQFSQPSTPQNTHNAPTDIAGPSLQIRLPSPTSAPSSSSFTWRSQDEEQENAIRFQEPVVHDLTVTSDHQEGQVEIKWDTERKRRQGYFSQEEGSEKSNFRLYNQAKIDFGP